MTSIAIGAFALAAMCDIAAADRLPVPLNQIMPRLPPVPEPQWPAPAFTPCTVSATIIPLGEVTPAIAAKQTPDGIALIGGDADAAPPPAEESPPCPIEPD